jgi:hypothetical protein
MDVGCGTGGLDFLVDGFCKYLLACFLCCASVLFILLIIYVPRMYV